MRVKGSRKARPGPSKCIGKTGQYKGKKKTPGKGREVT